MIKPTVGRVVWYYRYGKTQLDAGEQPHAAFTAHVHSDRLVNIAAHDSNGQPYAVTSVRLHQEGDEFVEQRPFAIWMPYQVGQAKAVVATAA